MPISIVQQAKNSTAYQVGPLDVTLPAKTSANSYLVVVVEAQKSGYPFGFGSIITPSPIVTDDKSNLYGVPVDKFVQLSQDAIGTYNPDAAGYFPSAYIYVAPAAANTQKVSIAAFYPDEYTSPLQAGLQSPPVVNGRAVFDGGIHAQVFEVAGLNTGVDVHQYTYGTTTNLGASLITTSAAAIIFEVAVLIDSSAISAGTNATLQHSGILHGGSSHFIVQSRIVGSALASSGFSNPIQYKGGVVAVSLK
jgi:hypothetical protein